MHHDATGQAEYWIEFIHEVFLKFKREADGLEPRVSGGKGVARNLPVAVDLLHNE